MALTLRWVIIQPITLLKDNGIDQKYFFKKGKVKFKLIFQVLDKPKDLLPIDIPPSERVVILKGRIEW